MCTYLRFALLITFDINSLNIFKVCEHRYMNMQTQLSMLVMPLVLSFGVE